MIIVGQKNAKGSGLLILNEMVSFVKIAIMSTNGSMVGVVQRWNVDPEQEHQTQEGSLHGS